jgi:hypothetical protein
VRYHKKGEAYSFKNTYCNSSFGACGLCGLFCSALLSGMANGKFRPRNV